MKTDWNYFTAKRAAFRLARKLAREKHIILKRFIQKYLIDDDGGPEWFANSIRGSSYVRIWYPIGDKDKDECRASSPILFERERFLFGIRIVEK